MFQYYLKEAFKNTLLHSVTNVCVTLSSDNYFPLLQFLVGLNFDSKGPCSFREFHTRCQEWSM